MTGNSPQTTPTDRRHSFFASFDLAAEILSAVPAASLHQPTPCPDFDMAALISHLVGAANQGAQLGRGAIEGNDFEFPAVEAPESPELVRLAKKEAEDAWADASRLEATTIMPWGETYSGYTLVDMYLVELTAHSWDLAASIGELDRLETHGAHLAGPALEGARCMLQPHYRNLMGPGNPFGDEVPVPDGASEWDHFAGFMGRAPKAT